jgi:hypothetical protein
LLWGAYGLDHNNDNPLSGLLLGGAEQGQLYVWDTAKIASNDSPLVHKFDKHNGPVASLDANPFQVCKHLLLYYCYVKLGLVS